MAASERWIDDAEPCRHVGRVQARRVSLRAACASLLLSVAPGCEASPSPAAVSGFGNCSLGGNGYGLRFTRASP